MKNIFKYSFLATLLIVMTGLTACQNEELDTDQYAGKLALAAVAPNPVMRGAELRIIGANLDKVSEVRFAGGASVSSIQTVASGSRSEIRLTVPMDAQVGPVTVVGSDGLTASTRFDLEYTEPIVFSSFAPATALSGDVVTIKGEYLNNVREVILGGGVYVTEFNSQSGNELSFTVPSNAISGYVIVGDVNEIEDQNTIPNQIYSETELVIGDPTVAVADTTTYKSGDVIKVSGSHLDMIEKVDLNGASEVEFTTSEDGSTISFNLPASATDGQIKLTSFAGKEFEAGFVQTLSVADLVIASIAEDGRYKAGSDVKITGSDLDLVTKVEFTGAEAQWYLDGKDIVATIPAEAKDGGVTVTLGSGKKAYTEAIELVKPIATWISGKEAVAGVRQLAVVGTDLDLVTGVTIGDKDNGLINCGFNVSSADTVRVNIPKDAYTGVLTLTAANGDFTQTDEITVTYDEAVSIVFDEPSYALGRKITISGSNLLSVESISVKGKKVTEYQVRADNAMSFSLPGDIASPGAYRLELVLIDGTKLTWAVPFEVTAPFTELTIWEGSQIINGWSGVTFGDDRLVWEKNGIREGDVIKIYFTAPEEGWWDLQLLNGHWGALSIPELDGGNEVKQGAFPGGTQTFSFNVTPEIIASLTEDPGWGGAFLINGDGNVEVTKISHIQYGATETIVWEGEPVDLGNWAINWEMKPATMFVDNGLVDGMTLHIYVTPTADYWQIQFFDGHWGGMDVHMGNGNNLNAEIYTIQDGRISIPVTPDIAEKFTTLTDWGYCGILQGESLIINKISIE